MPTRIKEYGGMIGLVGYDGVVPESQLVKKQPAMTATTDGTNRSATFNVGTRIVMVQSDEQVYVEFGVTPTATADSDRLNAGGEKYFEVSPGWKVAIRL